MEAEIVSIENSRYLHTSKKPSTIYTCKNDKSLTIIIIRWSNKNRIFSFENYKKQNIYKPFTMLCELKNVIKKSIMFEKNNFSSFNDFKIDLGESDGEEEDYLFSEIDGEEEDYLFSEIDGEEEDYLFSEIYEEEEDYVLPEESFLSSKDESLSEIRRMLEKIYSDVENVSDIKSDLSIEEFYNTKFDFLNNNIVNNDILYSSYDSNNNLFDSSLTRIDLYNHNSFYKTFHNEDSIITTLDISNYNDYFIFNNIIEKYTF